MFSNPTRHLLRLAATTVLLSFIAVALSACSQPLENAPASITPSEQTKISASSTITETPLATQQEIQPTETPKPNPTFDPNLVKDWSSGQLVFDLSERNFGEINYKGIYSINLADDSLREIAPEGIQLLDISPDYQQILVSQDQILDLIDLGTQNTYQISDRFFNSSPAGASWDKTANTIYFIANSTKGNTLLGYQVPSGSVETITSDSPISILYTENGTIVWGQGSCNQFGDCTYQGLQWSDSEGQQLAARELGSSILLPCQIGDEYAYAERDENDALSFHIQSLAEGTEIIFWALNTEYADCAWSPDQSSIAVTLIDRGWYSGIIQRYHFQLLNPKQSQLIDLSFLPGPMDNIFWSPDGNLIAYTGTSQDQDSYSIKLYLLDVESQDVTNLNGTIDFQSNNYLAVHHLFWLPPHDIGGNPE